MKKSLTAIFVAMMILTTCISLCVASADEYDNNTPPQLLSDNVIEIYTAEDLFALREAIQNNERYTLGKTIELMQDIDLDGAEWSPMGYNETEDDYSMLRHTFTGVFNGNGHSISNFTITSPEYNTVGFFADAYNAAFNDLTISNAVIDITQTDEAATYSTRVALLCGNALNTDFNNCRVSGILSLVSDMNDDTDNIYAGMLAGASIGSVINSETDGTINFTACAASYVGGIIGVHTTFASHTPNVIDNCVSNVNINVRSDVYENDAHIGGISGGSRTTDHLIIRNCKYGTNPDAYPQIDGNGFYSMNAGGITTSSYGEIVDCSTAADISISCKNGYGRGSGIAVFNYGTLTNCHSSANVSIITDSTRSAYAAGIVCLNGKVCSSPETAAQIDEEHLVENCTFSEGGSLYISSNASNSIGGIAAYAYPTSRIKRCYSATSNFDVGTSASLYLSPIVGNSQGGIIEQCSASGIIKPSGTVTGTMYVGGITGELTTRTYYRYNEYGEAEAIIDGAVIENCFADVDIDVKARALHAGGIAGYVYGGTVCTSQQPTVRYSKFSGSISISPSTTSFAGGVTGYVVDGVVENCYSVCEITEAAAAKTSAQIFIGGCVARLKQNATVSTPISYVRNCYTDSVLNTSGNASKLLSGTFASELSANASGLYPVVSDCYYVQGGAFDNSTATAITRDELAIADSFNDWDFDKSWYMSDTQPKLFFEEPAILGYDCDRDVNSAVTQVNSIDVASIIGSNTLYIVAFDFGVPVCIQTFDLKDNRNMFLNIDCNMPIPYSADAIKIFTWTDNMKPLLDTYEIPITSWQ